MYSTGGFSGLKWAIFAHFPEVLVTYKRHTPLYIGLFSLQICPDLRGVENSREKGGNPPIGGKKYTLYFLPGLLASASAGQLVKYSFPHCAKDFCLENYDGL